MPAALDFADQGAELVHRGSRDHELVLQETSRPVRAVPLPDQVQRVVEGGQALHLAGVGAALGVPERAERGESEPVRQPVREDIGQGEQRLGVEMQRVAA